MPSPANTAAWKSLASLAAHRDPTSKLLSALNVEACGFYADFSRQHLPRAVIESLLALANQQQLLAARDAQFSGVAINRTENLPVLHTALRAKKPLVVDGTDVRALVTHQLQKMRAFVEGIRSGRIRTVTEQAFTDVVAIGIGGSSLGPRLACAALTRFADGPRVHFVSNVDGAQLTDVLLDLNPATTLFLVTSKTFTTDETMSNARAAQRWLDERLGTVAGLAASTVHVVAITAKPDEAKRQGYADERIFEFEPDPHATGEFYLTTMVQKMAQKYKVYTEEASMWIPIGTPEALANAEETLAQTKKS